MEERDRVHNIPVPERFLPLVHKTLAEAYAAEAIEETGREVVPQSDSAKRSRVKEPIMNESKVKESVMDEWTGVWTKDQVVSAYRRASPKLRPVLEYLAKYSENEVTALELARAVYPNDRDDVAEKRLYGTLRGLTTPTYKYGHVHWFVKADRERKPDGSLGGMVYTMFDREAVWVKEASGHE